MPPKAKIVILEDEPSDSEDEPRTRGGLRQLEPKTRKRTEVKKSKQPFVITPAEASKIIIPNEKLTLSVLPTRTLKVGKVAKSNELMGNVSLKKKIKQAETIDVERLKAGDYKKDAITALARKSDLSIGVDIASITASLLNERERLNV